jgi:hypothetical protein
MLTSLAPLRARTSLATPCALFPESSSDSVRSGSNRLSLDISPSSSLSSPYAARPNLSASSILKPVTLLRGLLRVSYERTTTTGHVLTEVCGSYADPQSQADR